MIIEELKKILKNFELSIVYNADLKKKNWFNIGGKAKVFFKPNELIDLVEFLKVLNNKEKIHIIGAGSNTLITDEVYDGVVIKLGKNFNRLSVLNSNIIISGTAVLDKKLAEFAAENSLGGFEFLSCIPGTIGGGIKMNSGAYRSEIKDILNDVTAINKNGILKKFTVKDLQLDYRTNKLSHEWMFLKARFKSNDGSKEQIQKKMKEIIQSRKMSQPTGQKTGGSTFMNGKNFKAWELIDNSGCRGLKNGGAIISNKHCNFIINENNATATDIETLGEIVRKKVFEKTGKKLKWEIKIVGEK